MDEDYAIQSTLLKQRFEEKGYDTKKLEEERNEMSKCSQMDLLGESTKRQDGGKVPFITNFSSDFKNLGAAFRKHWHILTEDPLLRSVLPDRPNIIYRRAPTLRSKITGSYLEHKTPNETTQSDLTGNKLVGFHYCGRCVGCQQVDSRTKKLTFKKDTMVEEFKIKDFLTCTSDFVVYAIQCPCGLLYIGRTTRPLKIRIREHVYNIKRKLLSHNLSAHYATHHKGDPRHLNFWAVEKIRGHWRGSNKIRELSRRESFWIYTLSTLEPGGLNVEFDLNCFINNS